MADMRKKPELLNDKLLAIREFLNIGQVQMASKLESEIRDNLGREYSLQPARISEYEIGQREPNLFVLAAYARLGTLHLESVVDDSVSLEVLRSRLGHELNHAVRRKKHKTINAQDSPPATALLHKLTRVRINLDTQSIVAPKRPHLVCRYCKSAICGAVCQSCNTPLYAPDGSICYLHVNSGIALCEAPQVEGLLNRATPDEDNATYVAYRAELITEMTRCMFSYIKVLHSPGELMDHLLADVRHFADAHGLAFDEHERRSYHLYIDNKAEQPI